MGCCDGASSPKARNWRLYHLLDFVPPVSTLAVKYASSRATLRTQFHQAYWTLAEANRKFFYDIGGEGAFDLLSSATWGALVSFFGLRLYAFMFFVLGVLLVCLLAAFFILVGLRAEHMIDSSWQQVSIPLLIVFCVLPVTVLVGGIINYISFFSSTLPLRPTTIWGRLAPIGHFLASIAYLISAILFFNVLSTETRIREHIGMYMYYLIPVIVGDTLYYCTSFTWRWPSVVKRKMKVVGGEQPSRVVYMGIPSVGVLHWICCIVQWILLGFRLDQRIQWMWYIVVVPFGVRGVLFVVDAVLRSALRRAQGVRTSCAMLFDVLGSIFLYGSLVISLYWVAVWLEEPIFIVSMCVALVPVYMVLLYALIGVFFTCFITEFALSDLEAQEKRLQFMWSPSEKEGVEPSDAFEVSGEGGMGHVEHTPFLPHSPPTRRTDRLPAGTLTSTEVQPPSGRMVSPDKPYNKPTKSVTQRKSSSFPSQLESGGLSTTDEEDEETSDTEEMLPPPLSSSRASPTGRSREKESHNKEKYGESKHVERFFALRRTATPKRNEETTESASSDPSSSSYETDEEDEEYSSTLEDSCDIPCSHHHHHHHRCVSDSSLFSDEEESTETGKRDTRLECGSGGRKKSYGVPQGSGSGSMKRRSSNTRRRGSGDDGSMSSRQHSGSGSYIIQRKSTAGKRDAGNCAYTTTTTVSVRVLSSSDSEEDDNSYSYEYLEEDEEILDGNLAEHEDSEEEVQHVRPKPRRGK